MSANHLAKGDIALAKRPGHIVANCQVLLVLDGCQIFLYRIEHLYFFHFAFIYGKSSYSTSTNENDKITIVHQPWTRRYQWLGIAELWTLQSAVGYQWDNSVMNVPLPLNSGGETFDLTLWQRLSVLCIMTRSWFSSRPLLPKRQTCSTSARTTEECLGGRDAAPPVGTNQQWAAFLTQLVYVFSIGGDRTLESVTTLPSEFGSLDLKIDE